MKHKLYSKDVSSKADMFAILETKTYSFDSGIT